MKKCEYPKFRPWIQQAQERLNRISKAERIVAKALDRYFIYYTRNHPIQITDGPLFFADFFLWHNCLIVEIDGPEHDAEKDSIRDAEIKGETAFRIVRFKNADVFNNIGPVVEKILEEAPVRYSPKITRKAIKKQVWRGRQALKIYKKMDRENNNHWAAIVRGY